MSETERRHTPTEPWLVANATTTPWQVAPGWGRFVRFEPEGTRFRDYGYNIHVLEPGERSTMYHGEDGQEDFLVLAGTCTAIVEGERVELGPWDVLHCPAWTRHAFANTGGEPCAILMIGARRDGAETDVEYPVDPQAVALGAGVEVHTTESDVAYAGTPDYDVENYKKGTLPGA